jgi:tripartite-type tricarboxylate transporter receptor subunit TctC
LRPPELRALVERLNKELDAALATDEVKKRLADEGAPCPPEEYAADLEKEDKKWGALARPLNLKVE